jgi:hypothetical protein
MPSRIRDGHPFFDVFLRYGIQLTVLRSSMIVAPTAFGVTSASIAFSIAQPFARDPHCFCPVTGTKLQVNGGYIVLDRAFAKMETDRDLLVREQILRTISISRKVKASKS